jgi:UPF0755 protein
MQSYYTHTNAFLYFSMFKRVFIVSGLLLCIAALAALFLPISPEKMTVSIAQGAGLRTVAKQLAQQTDAPAWALELAARATGEAKRIKAGTFTVAHSQSLFTVWRALNQATPEMAQIKLLEGWTFKQMRAAIDAAPDLKHDTAGQTNAAIMAALGVPELHPEGRFFPDTYAITAGSSDVLVYKTAFEKMRKTAAKVWATREAASPLQSVDDLLNLAAIIEKETAAPSERRIVASVFHNRLKIGMRLQTDPTVIYGMGDAYKGRIRKVDLETDTPYNTYTRNGLPPTPIAAPSEAALEAAIRPDTTPYFYFVAKGDGSTGSFFSATLPEHNRAVAQYLANRRAQ